MTEKELSAQRELFCQNYVVDSNATQSYLAAYPHVTPRTAATEGGKLLKKPDIARRIRDLRQAQINRVEVRQDDVLRELLRLGTIDAAELYNEDGTIKKPKDWPKHLGACISSVEVEELFEGSGPDRTHIGYTTKVKLWPKVQSLELLGKYLKLFTDKTEVSLSKTLEDLVAGSREKE